MTLQHLSPDYPKASRITPTAEASLAVLPHNPDQLKSFNHYIASLMLSIRAGHKPVLARSSSHTKTGNQLASISWNTACGSSRLYLKGSQIQAEPALPQNTLAVTIDDPGHWFNDVDKLLNAVANNCFVKTYLLDGAAVLSWDRASHGNTPTIILFPDGRIQSYYDWPIFLPEHLEPRHTEMVRAPLTYDHIKTPPKHTAPNHPFTWEALYTTDPPLPDCQIPSCPNKADYNALDPRDEDQGPLCNYHLYGPEGYVQTHLPYEDFAAWLSRTTTRLHHLSPMERCAHNQRAAAWKAHNRTLH